MASETQELFPVNEIAEKKRTCDRPGCGKEYSYKTAKSKYCSDSCRAHASIDNRIQGQTAKPVTMEKQEKPASISPTFTSANTLPPNAIFIIEELKRSRDLLQKSYDEEREKRKKSQAEKADLERQLRDIKHEHELEAIRNAKPTGLSGLAENPMVMQLMQHAGPALGELLTKLVKGKDSAPMISGTDGQLDSQEAQFLYNINTWFTGLEEEEQPKVYSIFDLLAAVKMQTPDQFDTTLTSIINLFKNGTTIQATPRENNGDDNVNYFAMCN